ncbi:MAG: GNAT family N-acetyltransferase [Clostridia bacterium]|nr:GNAT family N-acetyltransferase [Clostridia bacterium]
MIREIRSFDEYEDFIRELASHPLYSDPHFTYDKDNLYRSLKAKDKYAYAVSENGTANGLFVWIVLPDDRYIEMLIGFTGKEEAFTEMLSYMERNYGGYQMDFVFNPKNTAISRPLKRKGAVFDPEQQKMILTGPTPNVSTAQIEPLSEKWSKQYRDLHSVDTYWTAERILSAPDKFRVLLAVKDGQIRGYLDVQCCYAVNEIYALFIKPEAARQGYETALLAKAIELNRPNQMMVVVDADAEAEIELYSAAGFRRMEGQNSVTASYRAKTV